MLGTQEEIKLIQSLLSKIVYQEEGKKKRTVRKAVKVVEKVVFPPFQNGEMSFK